MSSSCRNPWPYVNDRQLVLSNEKLGEAYNAEKALVNTRISKKRSELKLDY
jgi:hypothetical protein